MATGIGAIIFFGIIVGILYLWQQRIKANEEKQKINCISCQHKNPPFALECSNCHNPQNEIYKILKNQLNSLWLTDIFGNRFKVNMSFIQNPTTNRETFEIDFEHFFHEDYEFENAQFNEELSLPNILK